MDSHPTTQHTSTRKWRRLAYGFVAVAAVAYVAMIATHVGAYAGGSDSSGYFNNAKLLREGLAKIPQRALPGLPPEKLSAFAYVPLGFRPIDDSNMVPTYPTGLPLLFAAASVIAGSDAGPHWTMAIHTLVGVLLVFGLGRQCGLSHGFAGLAALIVALSPLYLSFGLQAMTDVPALVWVTGAVMLAWQSRARPGFLMPVAAGAVFAMAVLMRPTNVIAIAPIAIALGLNWRRWISFGLGGLPFAIFLALYNREAYGDALASGYGDVSNLMTVGVVGKTMVHYGKWLPVLLTPLVVLALGLPWVARSSPHWTAILVTWIAGFAGFYAFYTFTRETWWYLRFLLPVFPALTVACLLVLQRLSSRVARPRTRWIAGSVIAAAIVWWSHAWGGHFYVLSMGLGDGIYRDSVMWTQENLPSDAVVVTMQNSGALIYYTNLTIIRWDAVSAADVEAINNNLSANNRPMFALLHPWEVEDATVKRFPGEWTQVGAVRHMTIWRRESAKVASEN